MEFELTLKLPAADVVAFRRIGLLKQYAPDRPRSWRLRGTYFDTPELHLKKYGIVLCVQRAGRGWIETLTVGSDPAAGQYQRLKWEARVDGLRPDLHALAAQVEPSSKRGKLLMAPALSQGLVPMFEFEVRRTVWPLRMPSGFEVELALDQGELRERGASEPVCDVNIALRAGDPAALFDFVLLLQEHVPLRLCNRSMAERGYLLKAPQSLPAVKAGSVILGKDMTAAQGFLSVVGNCLAHMQGNERGVMTGIDPESVHQMRVGMRRLRSALRLFAKWISFPQVLQSELDWLNGELSAARDADVLADDTVASVVKACPRETELLPLQQSLSTNAAAKRQQAAAAVGSMRYARLMVGLSGWLQGSHWQDSLDASVHPVLAGPLDKCAAQMVARRHKKLLESGNRLEDGTPEKRHRVRIAAKKARYATEFFQSLHSARRVKHYIKILAALQETLGALNDAAVADRQLREIERHHPDLAGGASFARGFLCASESKRMHQLAKLWRSFSATDPP